MRRPQDRPAVTDNLGVRLQTQQHAWLTSPERRREETETRIKHITH
jgi:hypothetical protein